MKNKLIFKKIAFKFLKKLLNFLEIYLKKSLKFFIFKYIKYTKIYNKKKYKFLNKIPKFLFKRISNCKIIRFYFKNNNKIILKKFYLIIKKFLFFKKFFLSKENKFNFENVILNKKNKFNFESVKLKMKKYKSYFFFKDFNKKLFLIKPFFFKKQNVQFSVLKKNKFYFKSQNVRVRQICYNSVFLCLSLLTLVLIFSSGKFYFFEKSFFDMNYFYIFLYLLIPFFFNKVKTFFKK